MLTNETLMRTLKEKRDFVYRNELVGMDGVLDKFGQTLN